MMRKKIKNLLGKLVERMPTSVLLDREQFHRWQELGFHVTPVHFYQPIPDTRELPERLWDGPTEMRGVEMAPERQLEVLEEITEFKAEYESIDLIGGSFGCPDAEILFSMVRKRQPKRIIEVGTGTSTKVIAKALACNLEKDPGATCEFVSIDPYPNREAIAQIPGGSRVIQKPVQDVPLETFEELEAGDIFFIDSSHVVAVGSDVRFEILDALPRLAPGVIVHLHDIHLPYEYKREWVMESFRFWNEAYLLQAFLAYNNSFRVLISGCYLDAYHRESLHKAFDRYDPERRPGSFWLERVR